MLRPKRKITRQEIKKDPVLEKVSQTEYFIRENGKMLSYIGIGIVLVVVLSVLIIRSKRSANQEASAELGVAQLSVANNDTKDAILRLEDLIEQYPNTHSAGLATNLLGNLYLKQSDYDNATLYFREYLDEYKDDDMITAAAYKGLATCLEYKEEYADAAANYEKAAKKAAYDFQKYEYSLDAARNYMQIGQLQKARELIKVVLDGDPAHQVKRTAEILQAEIKTRQG